MEQDRKKFELFHINCPWYGFPANRRCDATGWDCKMDTCAPFHWAKNLLWLFWGDKSETLRGILDD